MGSPPSYMTDNGGDSGPMRITKHNDGKVVWDIKGNAMPKGELFNFGGELFSRGPVNPEMLSQAPTSFGRQFQHSQYGLPGRSMGPQSQSMIPSQMTSVPQEPVMQSEENEVPPPQGFRFDDMRYTLNRNRRWG